MADNTTITSANSVFTLNAPSAGIVNVQLEGYAVDRAFFTDALTVAEVQMGVDGRMTAGYTPNPQPMHISLQADSPSRSVFTAINQILTTTREVIWLSGEVVLPATSEKFSLVRGVLTSTKKMPDAGKVLQPVEYTITWQSIEPSVL